MDVNTVCARSSQDCEIIEDGKKHVLVLYNCQLDMTGEISFQAANAKSAANLKVKGMLDTKVPVSVFCAQLSPEIQT